MGGRVHRCHTRAGGESNQVGDARGPRLPDGNGERPPPSAQPRWRRRIESRARGSRGCPGVRLSATTAKCARPGARDQAASPCAPSGCARGHCARSAAKPLGAAGRGGHRSGGVERFGGEQCKCPRAGAGRRHRRQRRSQSPAGNLFSAPADASTAKGLHAEAVRAQQQFFVVVRIGGACEDAVEIHATRGRRSPDSQFLVAGFIGRSVGGRIGKRGVGVDRGIEAGLRPFDKVAAVGRDILGQVHHDDAVGAPRTGRGGVLQL